MVDLSYSLACHRCFKDKTLIDFIREEGRRGRCDWCGARNVYVIPLNELGEIFREVVSIYRPGEWDDDSISFLMQEDWKVFSDKIEENPDDLLHRMTVAILEAGLNPKEYPSGDYPDYEGGFRRRDSRLVEYWHEKAEAYFEGKRQNRTIKKQWLDNQEKDDLYHDFPDQLEIVFEDLCVFYEPGKKFYRARIHKGHTRKERFDSTEMGAPPAKVMKAGRANREKQRVLYLASDVDTALAEVRAWKGMAVAVADLEIKERLSIVSLLQYDIPESPFFQEYLEWKLDLDELFRRLSYEMSMPIIAEEDKRSYFSTQFLCDWVRKAGYDGIEYPSAMGTGFNLVVFNPENVKPITVRYFRIEQIKHLASKLNNNEPIYDERPFDYLFVQNGESLWTS